MADCGRSQFIPRADPPSRIDVQAGQHSATVRWQKVADASGYRVYGAPNSMVAASNFQALGGGRLSVITTSAVFTTLTDSADWFFFVESVRDGHAGLGSPRVQVRPLGLGTNATLPTISASTRIDGDQGGARFGFDVESAGDVNGDGYDDIIVGQPNRQVSGQNNGGRAQIFLGSSSGIATTAVWTVESNAPGGILGFAAVGIGDLNRDGYDDVLVCSPALSGGEALIYLGKPGGPLTNNYSFQIPAPLINTDFGYSCSGLGDINGDGYDDFAIGAPREPPGQTGAVYVYLGGPTGPLNSTFQRRITAGSNLAFGISVAKAGDVDGDTHGDLLVGGTNVYLGAANTDPGQAWLFRGGPSGISSAATWTVTGDQPNSILGYRVRYGGDVNGDGNADIVLGAAFESSAGAPSAGRTLIYLGTAGGVSLAPARTIAGAPGEQSGLGSGGIGDLDGDGTADLCIAGPTSSDGGVNAGRVRFFSGGIASTPRSPIVGLAGGDLFGYTTSPAGDVNGDGSPDVIVGAIGAGGGAGAVTVLYGPPRKGPRADAGDLLTGSPGSPIAPANASFTDLAVGTSWSCTWTWGDGTSDTIPCTPATAAAVSHTWTFAGRYEVRLTVTNVFGLAGQSLTMARIGQAAVQSAAAAGAASPTEASSSGSAGSSRR